MDARLLTTFESVARSLNFTRAAKELGYVQSTVTAQIKALEADVGVQLFERLGRTVLLTDAGEELHREAPDLLRHVERARDAVITAGDPDHTRRGTLRIAAPESLCSAHLPAVLKDFQEHYPHVMINFHPAGRHQVLDDVTSGAIDVGFLLEKSVSAPGVVTEKMMREPFRLVCAPSHDLAGSAALHAEDLAQHKVLLLGTSCAQRGVMDEELRPMEIRPQTMEFTTMEPVKRSAAAGLGVALLPASAVAAEIARGELVEIPFATSPALFVFSVRRSARRQSPLVEEFLKLAGEHWDEVR